MFQIRFYFYAVLTLFLGREASAEIIKVYADTAQSFDVCTVTAAQSFALYKREQNVFVHHFVKNLGARSLKKTEAIAADLIDISLDVGSKAPPLNKPIVSGTTYPPQEAFSVSDLTPSEKRLVDLILKHASNKKRAGAGENDREGIAHYLNSHGFGRFMAVDDFLQLQAIMEPAAKGKVEIGAWRVLLKNGDSLAVVFTSNGLVRLNGEDVASAINNQVQDALREIGVTWDDVFALQFFHNHPSAAPLSVPDFEAATSYQEPLKRFHVPVHIYAISEYQPGEVVIFHNGIEVR